MSETSSEPGTSEPGQPTPAEGEPRPDAGDQSSTSEQSQVGDRESLLARLELEGEVAADYLEGLLDIADLDGDIDMDVEGERASVSIVGADLSDLVGADGRVLEALQELTRLAVTTRTGERSRLMLDISGHRARRREELREEAAAAVARVRDSGTFVRLAPMTPFERKIVHDAVAEAGLRSESEGVEPDRRVVVHPVS